MKTIYKYDIQFTDGIQAIEMPCRAKILSFQNQGGVLRIWALIDPAKRMEKRLFVIYETGHPIDPPDYELEYISTAQQGPFVWHLFEAVYDR